MKKTYQAPIATFVTVEGHVAMLAGSTGTEGLDGFGGNGGGKTGSTADSRHVSFWDDEEE